MNARELMEVLGAGDLDAEVYVAMPGDALAAPLASIDDVDFDRSTGDDEPPGAGCGLVLWPAATRRRRFRIDPDRLPLVGP